MGQEAIIETRRRSATRTFEWLTVEHAGYGLVMLVALGVRLWGLGTIALGPTEALQTLPAVASAQGAVPDLSGVSPLLHALQVVTFILFGATDGTARFWPALLGGLSPVLFFCLRNHLTPGGALAGALLWALSPLGVWSGRLSLGDGLTPTLALALLAVIAWEGRARGWAAALGFVAGLLLTGGSNAFTVLLGGVAAALLWTPSLGWPWSRLSGQWRTGLSGLLAAALVVTVFLAEPAGLAAGAELLGRWLSDLIPGRGEYGSLELLARLFLSELFVLGFGIAGFVWSVRNRARTGVRLGVATAFTLAVALIGRGRHPVDLALVSLGLTLLAGPAVARVLSNAYEWRRERDSWLLVLVSLVLLFSAAIGIPSGINSVNTEGWRSVYLGVGIATLAMSLIVWVAYGVWDNWRIVARAAPVVPLLLGLAWQVSSLVSLSYDRGAGRQSGIIHEMPATDLDNLRGELRNLSALNGGGGREANVDVVWSNLASDPILPMLRWQLRDFPSARFGGSIPVDAASLILTPVEEQPRLGSYSGAEFAVLQRWTSTVLPDFVSTLRWVLYREAHTPPETTRLILWVNKSEK